MTSMFSMLFKDALNEFAYAAELAGLKWDLINTKYGMVVSTVYFIVICSDFHCIHAVHIFLCVLHYYNFRNNF